MSEVGSEHRDIGRVLGGRFELHGILGRGGTATVWLATDRLRQQRVALKLVHPHLLADPSTRRRLEREVHAASVVRSDAALVPFDIHELDETMGLSMPFHAGQTLAERVATRGALSPDQARTLAIRLATALAEAHRVGVLHRDVSANNVLVDDDPGQAVLTDFGLARLGGDARSTALLGTAGYAAPEVYNGQRSDPRSDLYGLGAVLYLALTGRPAFDPKEPMTALRRQIDEGFRPIRESVPRCPPDLADLIARLLRADPAHRPQGAREVLDRLEGRSPTHDAPAAERALIRPLPSGTFTVVFREKDEQRVRRNAARRRVLNVTPTVEDRVLELGGAAVESVHAWVRGRSAGRTRSVEEALHAAIADVAGARPDQLVMSPVLYERAFRLVDGTDAATAWRLASLGKTLGFRAKVVEMPSVPMRERPTWPWAVYAMVQVAGWVMLGVLLDTFGLVALAAMLAVTVGFPMWWGMDGGAGEGAQRLAQIPFAYPASLAGMVRGGATVATSAQVDPASRGTILEERAKAEIERLLADVGASPTLPDLAKRDLRESAHAMRAQAEELAADLRRIERVLADAAEEGEVDVLRTRLDRLATLEAAGEPIDGREREQLRRALEQHRAAREAADRLESDLAAASARLVEIASAAAQARRELAQALSGAASHEWVSRIVRDSRASVDATREVHTPRRDPRQVLER